MSDGASPAAIEHHYDVGTDFYRLWLDTRMVYSCALWPGGLDDDLDGAQTAKLAWHADGARVAGAGRVLDVGCGWGSLMSYLVEERAVEQVTGLTLSSDQAASITERSDARTDVRLEDWRDHSPTVPYDGIISIGAFEHFTRHDLPVSQRRAVYAGFFDRCADWLGAGGRLSLQTIAYEDFDIAVGAVSSFFANDIFPESALPRLSDIIVTSDSRFRMVQFRNDPAHYEHTLHLWQRRLEARKDEAMHLVDRDTYRRYLRYLRVSRAMFDRRVATLYRLVFERRPVAITGGPGAAGAASGTAGAASGAAGAVSGAAGVASGEGRP